MLSRIICLTADLPCTVLHANDSVMLPHRRALAFDSLRMTRNRQYLAHVLVVFLDGSAVTSATAKKSHFFPAGKYTHKSIGDTAQERK